MSKRYLASFIFLVCFIAVFFQNCGEGFRTSVDSTISVGRGSSVSSGSLSLQLISANPVQTTQSVFEFRLLDMNTMQPVLDRDLAIMSEKKLHLVVVDNSLNDFTHIHPVESNGVWQVPITLKYQNQYSFFVQGRLSIRGICRLHPALAMLRS